MLFSWHKEGFRLMNINKVIIKNLMVVFILFVFNFPDQIAIEIRSTFKNSLKISIACNFQEDSTLEYSKMRFQNQQKK